MGKLCLLCIAIFLAFTTLKAQNVGINSNGAAPDASAMLDNALPFKNHSSPICVEKDRKCSLYTFYKNPDLDH